MESELERLERDVLEREEATLREEMKLRLVREEESIRSD